MTLGFGTGPGRPTGDETRAGAGDIIELPSGPSPSGGSADDVLRGLLAREGTAAVAMGGMMSAQDESRQLVAVVEVEDVEPPRRVVRGGRRRGTRGGPLEVGDQVGAMLR